MFNLIEPPQWHDLFIRHPPVGVDTRLSRMGVPVFNMVFDLLTTVEPSAARRIRRIPLLSKLLRFKTWFVGTTVTEYVPLPEDLPPEKLIRHLLVDYSSHALTIIKDLPFKSPFLDDAQNDYADRLAAAAEKAGFIVVDGQALAYVPIDFATVDEYLNRLSASRRKDLRRKMKTKERLEIKVMPLGDPMFESEALLADCYAMYKNVYDQSEIHFDLLSSDFFHALFCGKNGEGIVILYYAEGTLAGYNICLISRNMLIDKYIGFTYPQARDFNLYFVSWLINLQLALDRGLQCYVAGWTDQEVKASLGARFTFTRHLVRIKNPVLRTLLLPFKRFFESDKNTLERT